MKNRWYILLYIGGFSIFGILLYNYGFGNILLNLRKTGLYFIPIIALWALVYLLNNWALYIILGRDSKKTGFWRLFGISLSGFAINYITPFINLGGEPYRMLALRPYVGKEKAVSSVTLYVMLHMLSHTILWMSAICLTFFLFPMSKMLFFALAAVFALTVLMIAFFISRHKKGIIRALYDILRKVPGIKKFAGKIHEDSIAEIDKQVISFYMERRRSFYLALTIEFIARSLMSLEYLFILLSIGIKISLLQAFYVNAVASFILNVLTFMPMELGTRELSLYLVIYSLNTGNINPGVYIALVTRLREFFWIAIGLGLVKINSALRKVYSGFHNLREE